MIKDKKTVVLALMGLALILFFIFSPSEKPTAVYDKSNDSQKINPFANIQLEAKSAYVFDFSKNEPLYQLNSQAQLPLASLTKIMTVVVAEEIVPDKEKNNIAKLVEESLVASSNEAASTLASLVGKFNLNKNFIALMNEKAKDIGLTQTYFLNETGLDISHNISGAYGSAEDVVRLISYALKNYPDLLEPTTYKNIGTLTNTDEYVENFPRLIASKTGFTDLAGGNLVVVFDAGFSHPVAAVVLGSSKEGRFIDMQKLIKATYKYLSSQ